MSEVLSDSVMSGLESAVSGYESSGSYAAESMMSCGCSGNCGQSCAGGCEAGCSGDCGRSCSGSCS